MRTSVNVRVFLLVRHCVTRICLPTSLSLSF